MGEDHLAGLCVSSQGGSCDYVVKVSLQGFHCTYDFDFFWPLQTPLLRNLWNGIYWKWLWFLGIPVIWRHLLICNVFFTTLTWFSILLSSTLETLLEKLTCFEMALGMQFKFLGKMDACFRRVEQSVFKP